jgi:transposase-like protein
MEQAERDEKAQAIVAEIADTGKSLRSVCESNDVKPSTFLLWVSNDSVLAEQYARAMQVRADTHFSEIVEISDKQEIGTVETAKEWGTEIKTADMVEHRRLRIDARKWVIARMNPRKYGDKLELAGNTESPLTVVVKSYAGNQSPE